MPTKSTLLKSLKAFDFDSDGFVSPDELMAILNRPGNKAMSKEDAEAVLQNMLQKLDKDKDGKLSFEELACIFADEEEPATPAAPDAPAPAAPAPAVELSAVTIEEAAPAAARRRICCNR